MVVAAAVLLVVVFGALVWRAVRRRPDVLPPPTREATRYAKPGSL